MNGERPGYEAQGNFSQFPAMDGNVENLGAPHFEAYQVKILLLLLPLLKMAEFGLLRESILCSCLA
jgi:hypothetical protein